MASFIFAWPWRETPQFESSIMPTHWLGLCVPILDGIFKDLNDRWLNLSGSKSTQRCVSFSWKFRRKIELIFCPKLSAQFQYMYLTKQWQVCFKIWSPLHVFRELKANTYILSWHHSEPDLNISFGNYYVIDKMAFIL